MSCVVALLLLFLPREQPRLPAVPMTVERPCPLEIADESARANLRCLAETGANWTFAFAYPRTAERIPALHQELRRRHRAARAEFERVVAHASRHPEGRFFHEQVFTVDADLPELLALSHHVGEYSGGAHGWDAQDVLIWHRAGNRPLAFEQLFAAPATASAEMRRLLCPALAALAMQRRGPASQCPEPPYPAALLAGPSGKIETLRVPLGEIHGRAGGYWEVRIPVTPAIVAAVQAPLRAAFGVSEAAPRACNNIHCIEGQRQ